MKKLWAVCLLMAGAGLGFAQNRAPVQTYYLPLPEADLRTFPASVDTGDSYADGSTGRTDSFSLGGQTLTELDAGLLDASLQGVSGHLFNDVNNNGVQDVGEPDLAGVDVVVVDSVDGTQTVATASNGEYVALVAAPGSTTVDVDEATLPVGYTLTTANKTQVVTVLGDQVVDSNDVGYHWNQLDITKISSPTGEVASGDVITYTMVVTNSSATVQNHVVVTDPLPSGVSYVPGSTTVTAPFQASVSVTNTVGDTFSSPSWNLYTGSNLWNGAWVEANDTGGQNPAGTYVMISGGSLRMSYIWAETVQRSADLSGATAATLRVNYTAATSGGTAVLEVAAATAAGGPFTSLPGSSMSGTASGTLTLDLTSYIGAETTIIFRKNGTNWISSDLVTIESVEIDAVWSSAVRGDQVLTPVSLDDGTPPTLVTTADQVSLLAGERMIVEFQATVDAVPGVSNLVNVASVVSDEQTTPLTAGASNPFVEKAVLTDLIFRDDNSDGIKQAGEPVLHGVDVRVIDSSGTTQTVTTAVSGYYTASVPIGMATVEVVEASLPAGYSLTTGNDPQSITVVAGTNALEAIGYDFTVIQLTDVGISKTVSDANPMEGQEVLFTLTAVCNGPGVAPSVQITDILPSGVTYVSDNGGGAFNAVSGVWNIGLMFSGDSASLVIRASVDSGTAGTSLTNSVMVTSVGQTDTNAANDSAGAGLLVQTPQVSPDCGLTYVVADAGGANGGDDWFTKVDRDTGVETPVGTGTGTTAIEAMAFNAGATILYAADADELGSIDLSSGVYTTIGAFGTGTGADSARSFNDVDGLTFDPLTGILYGSVRRNADPDLLIQINPQTGAFVPNAFGAGIDYVVVNVVSNHADIDDIAIDAYDGQMYGIANSGGYDDRLVKINKLTGAATNVGLLGVDDHEGLSFDNSGQLFGTTGTLGGNSLFYVDKSTGAAYGQIPLSAGTDYESSESLLCPPNTIEGTVFLDTNGDALLDGGDLGADDVIVQLYRDVNTDGLVDVNDILVATQQTDSNGEYSFEVASVGAFVLDVDTDSLPTGATLTTDNVEVADFGTETGLVERGNDFGYIETPTFSVVKTSSAAPVFLREGDTNTYTITVSNVGTTTQTGIQISDTLHGALSYDPFSTVVSGYKQNVPAAASVADQFATAAYVNQDGSADWSGPWTETGDSGSGTATDGTITVSGGVLQFAGAVFNSSVQRSADLSGATNAQLSLTWTTVGLEESAKVQISSNGTDFVTLLTVTGQTGSGTLSEDISAYISGTTTLRFLNDDSNWSDPLEYARFDNVQISYAGDLGISSVTNDNLSGGAFADLVDGVPVDLVEFGDDFVLAPGASMTVTFRAVVNEDLPVGLSAIPNTVNVRSLESPVWQEASCSDPLSVSAIGSRVWLDENSDGVQDAGEAGIPNVEVELRDSESTLLATTVTDSDGGYLFTGLHAGDYTVIVDPASMSPGLRNVTYDEDSGTVSPDSTTEVTFAANTEHMSADFGYNWNPPTDVNSGSGTAAIGSRIWIDTDGDGIQDPGEAGLAGASIVLYGDADGNGVYDTVVGSTTSDDAGNYIFDGLTPGPYLVDVNGGAAPAGYAQTGDPDGTLDSRTTQPVVLAPGDVYLLANFGYQPTGSAGRIGESVWFDANADGVQDGSEPGIAGVTVALVKDLDGDGIWDAGEPIIATDITDSDGAYEFSGLPIADGTGTDDYLVWVNDAGSVLLNLGATADGDGLSAPVSGLVAGENISAVTNLGTAAELGQNFGYTAAGHTAGDGMIGTTIFVDADSDDQPDAGEGREGVTVELYDSTRTTLLATTVSDENGFYAFGGLDTNLSYVVTVAATNFAVGGALEGLNNTYDSDGGLDSTSQVLTFTAGVNLDQNFGYRPTTPNSAGGTLWGDTNANGTLDAAETTRLAGVTLVLSDTNGNVVATTVTDSSGNYLFEELPDGTYVIDVTDDGNLLGGFWHSDGPNDGSDGNSQDDPYTVTLSGGTADQTGDFGYQRDASQIGDFVWNDLDLDGLQDGGEPGLTNVTVTLTITYPDNTVVTVVTLTDLNGGYTFGNLLFDEDYDGDALTNPSAGEPVYVVTVTTPAGYAPALSDVGGNDSIDSDDGAAGETTLPQTGTPVENVDFGFYEEAEISGHLYDDVNGNGAQDAGEPDLADVDVIITNSLGAVQIVPTDSSGDYTATVPPGSTVTDVDETDPDFPSGATQTEGTDPTVTTAVAGTDTFSDNDGFFIPLSIGSRVWIDDDLDGIRDAAETNGLSGVDVILYTTNGVAVATNTTDAAGSYQFDGLPPGNYYVVFDPATLPVGTVFTAQDQGGDTTDSDADTVTGQTAATGPLSSGQDALSMDAGVYATATIGDRLWFDANGDGLQDGVETGSYSNVPVALVDTNGTTVATDISDANGQYSFTVPPGTYRVQFDLSVISTNAWVEVTTANVGGDDSIDSDGTSGAVGGTVLSDLFTVVQGETNLLVDLGLSLTGATRADVVDVWGEWRGDTGVLVWETGSECNTAGFFVYGIDPQTGLETQLNAVLIPSAFEPGGARYEWGGEQAALGGTASFRIEEVELTGARRDLGTHEVVFSEPAPAVASIKSVSLSAFQTVSLPEVSPSDVLKVAVRDDGLYGIALQTLADGMGRSLSDLQALAADHQLRLTCQGDSVPFRFDAARERILFFGEAVDNWYARDAAVLISEGPGSVMETRSADAASGQTVFPVRVRFEEDLYPFDSAQSRPDDFYYWNYVISGHVTAGQRDIALDLTGFAGGDLSLTVRLQGWSSTPARPDHHAVFLLNGVEVGEATFDGQELVDAALTIPADAVVNGMNTLTVQGLLTDGLTHSFFVIDRVDAAFNRELVSLEDCALIDAVDVSSAAASGFAEPLVVALDAAGTPCWIENVSNAWKIESGDERFALIDAEDVPMLGTSPAVDDAWFMAASNRIDYLVITSRALEPAAQELADYRAEQGLRVGVACFEDICDLMTGGLRTPEAIPALLRFAEAGWEQAPWMVVLAGNGHYDYLNALNSEVNHLPPMLFDTTDGLFAADGLLSDLDGDCLPDVAIGRLPARTEDELIAMIDKIRVYEASFGSAAANRLVFAADAADTAGNFAEANRTLAMRSDAAHPVEQIDLDVIGVAAARAQLLAGINGGAGFVHYTGHGGVGTFSSQGLLSTDDVDAMSGSRTPPVVVALSCLVGRYEAPGLSGMGERLLSRSGGGAVAVWGPSGLSRNTPAVELGDAFYRALLQEGCGTLGLAILDARRSLSGEPAVENTVAVYNLLGDPALRVAGNVGGRLTDSNFAKWRWQQYSPEELADEEVGGVNEAFAAYVGRENLGLMLRNGKLSWNQNRFRTDLEYRLLISTDLVEWTPVGSALGLFSEEFDAGGVLKKITAVLNSSEQKLFFKLDVVPK